MQQQSTITTDTSGQQIPSGATDDDTTTVSAPRPNVATTGKGTKKDPNFRATVMRLIQDNPDATVNEIVRLTLLELPDKHAGTCRCHYYSVKAELNIPNNGVVGRKKNSGRMPLIKKFIAENPKASRADVIRYAVNELGLTESTAANYYPKAI